jgi:medium-chain acyl-[acyl-carrier-protein] hydrolase
MPMLTQSRDRGVPAPLPWVRRVPRPRAVVRLFCFPPAGGSAIGFKGWDHLLPDEIEPCAVEYPGRGRRRAEPSATRLAPLANAARDGLLPLLDMPYAVFGHCMGALLAFEILRRLPQVDAAPPVALVVAGSRAPSVAPPDPPLHRLGDDQLLSHLRALGGTPDELLVNPQASRFFFRALRADLEAAETYGGTAMPEPKLQCPIFAYIGRDDEDLRRDQVDPWARETHGPGTVRELTGDHFFVKSAERILITQVTADILGSLR